MKRPFILSISFISFFLFVSGACDASLFNVVAAFYVWKVSGSSIAFLRNECKHQITFRHPRSVRGSLPRVGVFGGDQNKNSPSNVTRWAYPVCTSTFLLCVRLLHLRPSAKLWMISLKVASYPDKPERSREVARRGSTQFSHHDSLTLQPSSITPNSQFKRVIYT